MKDIVLLDIVVAALVFYGLWAVYSALMRLFKQIKAKQDLKRYTAQRNALRETNGK